MSEETADLRADLRKRVDTLLAEHPPGATEPLEFLRAQFDAGLAWVHFPEGLGGLGLARGHQALVDDLLGRG